MSVPNTDSWKCRLEFNPSSIRIAQPQLQGPVVGDFRVFVLRPLADFDQQRVAAGLQLDRRDEAVEARAVGPLLASEHLLSVQPHRAIIVGTAAHLGRLLARNVDLRIRIAD